MAVEESAACEGKRDDANEHGRGEEKIAHASVSHVYVNRQDGAKGRDLIAVHGKICLRHGDPRL